MAAQVIVSFLIVELFYSIRRVVKLGDWKLEIRGCWKQHCLIRRISIEKALHGALPVLPSYIKEALPLIIRDPLTMLGCCLPFSISLGASIHAGRTDPQSNRTTACLFWQASTILSLACNSASFFLLLYNC